MGKAEDKVRIFAVISQYPGGIAEFNHYVRTYATKSFGEVERSSLLQCRRVMSPSFGSFDVPEPRIIFGNSSACSGAPKMPSFGGGAGALSSSVAVANEAASAAFTDSHSVGVSSASTTPREVDLLLTAGFDCTTSSVDTPRNWMHGCKSMTSAKQEGPDSKLLPHSSRTNVKQRLRSPMASSSSNRRPRTKRIRSTQLV